MAIKGHATIELTNVETGEKKVMEEDNMVTEFWNHFAFNRAPLVVDIIILLIINQTTAK